MVPSQTAKRHVTNVKKLAKCLRFVLERKYSYLHVLCTFYHFFIKHIPISWRRSLFTISNDTEAIKLVNNRLLHVKRAQFKQ